MAIDYGQKRVGIAVSDPGQSIATALTTIHVQHVFDFLKSYFSEEQVDCVVVGQPFQMNNTPSDSSRFIEPFVNKFSAVFPTMRLERADERFTTKIAKQAILLSGVKKKARQLRERVDAVSATILLQSYMEKLKY